MSCNCFAIPTPSLQSGKGLLRVMKCEVDGIADMVPVDMVNNCMISVGWITGLRPSPRPLIYQYTSGTVNPFTWRDLCKSLLSTQCTERVYTCIYSRKCWREYNFVVWSPTFTSGL